MIEGSIEVSKNV